jgi:GATA-binding protein, other eukaryote
MIAPQNRRVSHMTSGESQRSNSPVSRTGTPGAQDPNIAPQHIFDSVNLGENGGGGSPSLPPLNHAFGLSPNAMNGLDYTTLVANNETLRTRVSELEVINSFYSDNENNLRSERDKAVQERDEFKRKFEELQRQREQEREHEPELEHPAKKVKPSDDPSEQSTAEA